LLHFVRNDAFAFGGRNSFIPSSLPFGEGYAVARNEAIHFLQMNKTKVVFFVFDMRNFGKKKD
jgi:hypothetical protein